MLPLCYAAPLQETKLVFRLSLVEQRAPLFCLLHQMSWIPSKEARVEIGFKGLLIRLRVNYEPRVILDPEGGELNQINHIRALGCFQL